MPHLSLSSEFREELAEPRGVLIRGKPVPPSLLRLYLEPPIIAVGDVVADTLLHAGVLPELIIYDGSTRRGAYEGEELGEREADMILENPRSMISQDAQELFFDERPRGLLMVRGEEDLLAIPAALAAQPGSTVVYGQPGEGVVMLRVDDMLRGIL
jgi:uncharacterized protein (UPF0218 family)